MQAGPYAENRKKITDKESLNINIHHQEFSALSL
jgi:hypothetical protein